MRRDSGETAGNNLILQEIKSRFSWEFYVPIFVGFIFGFLLSGRIIDSSGLRTEHRTR
jgi:hypothetical protein